MGWDIDRFPEGEVNLELICCICTSILEDPVESPCRHVFCSQCIKTWLSNQKSCPHCRAPVHKRDLQGVVPLLKSIISKQRIFCDNKEKGCDEVVALDMLQSHVSVCNYGVTACPNDGCMLKILRKDLKGHCDACLKRTVMCDQGCEMFLTLGEKNTHNCIQAMQRRFQDTTNELHARISKLEEMVNALVSKNSQASQRSTRGSEQRCSHSTRSTDTPCNWAPYSIPSPNPTPTYAVLDDIHLIANDNNDYSDSVESVFSDGGFEIPARDVTAARDYDRAQIPQVQERGMSPVFDHLNRPRFLQQDPREERREERRRVENRGQRQSRSRSPHVTFASAVADVVTEYTERERRPHRRHRHNNDVERPSRYLSQQNTGESEEPLVLRIGVSSETVSDSTSSSSSSSGTDTD